MIDRDTEVVLVAIVLAIALWYASLGYTDSVVLQAAVLLGVGLGLPGVHRAVRSDGSA